MDEDVLSFPRPSTNVLTETSVPRVVAKLVDGKEVAIYHLVIRSSIGDWILFKRYSEFCALHESLLEESSANNVPKDLFPTQKRVFRNLDSSFLEDRRKRFEWYTRQLILVPSLATSEPVLEFMDVRNHAALVVQRCIRNWTKRFNHLQRMQSCVRRFVASPTANKLRSRITLLRQIIEEEEVFVGSLTVLTTDYVVSLQRASQTRNPVLDREDVEYIFAGLDMLYTFHQKLLVDLTERMEAWPLRDPEFGDIFLRMAPFLTRVYAEFTSNFQDRLARLRILMGSENVRSFFEDPVRRRESGHKPIFHFLELPFRRLREYQQTIQELLRLTPSTHIDHACLEMASNEMDTALTNLFPQSVG